MNKKTTYEITITEKLQQFPLPDMEDAIWARVKKQLDLDLPTDDGGGNAPDAPSGGGWLWGSGLFLFVAALVTIFLLTKNNEKEVQPIPGTSLQNTPTPAPSTTLNQRGDTVQSIQNSNGMPVQVFSPGASPPLLNHTLTDSIAPAPTANLPLADSVQNTALVTPPPVAVQDSVPRKRQKGVSGLSDNDYRIVPTKRDSL